jgi:hypothetical protein
MRLRLNALAGAIALSGAMIAAPAIATHPDTSFPKLYVPLVDGSPKGGTGLQLSFIRQGTFTPERAAQFRTGQTAFMTYYTGVEGDNQWLAGTFQPIPGKSVYENVNFVATDGANFDASGDFNTSSFDTGTVRFNSCNDVEIEFANGGTVEFAALQSEASCPFTETVPATVAEADPICTAGGGVATDFGPAGIGCFVDAANGPLTGSVTWANNVPWIISGNVQVGDETEAGAGVLTIDAGTTVAADTSTGTALVITQASKIDANGTAESPIILTSTADIDPNATPGDEGWGGLIVLGRAPINNCSSAPANEIDDSCEAVDEALTQFQYGGNNPEDSSGTIRYVQARYTGLIVTDDRELQSFSFFGVGEGTTVEYINSYASDDDGIEFFGGTVGVRNVVSSAASDDGFDWGFGWRGKAQYVLVYENGDHGIEADNLEGNFDAERRAQPLLANFSIVGPADEGARFRRGTGVNFYNSVISGAADACLNFDNEETFTAAGSPDNITGTLTLNNIVLFGCGAGNFEESDGDLWSVQSFFEAQGGNMSMDPSLTGYLPAAKIQATGPLSADDFIQAVDYIGAFRDANDDWTYPWAFGLPANQR